MLKLPWHSAVDSSSAFGCFILWIGVAIGKRWNSSSTSFVRSGYVQQQAAADLFKLYSTWPGASMGMLAVLLASLQLVHVARGGTKIFCFILKFMSDFFRWLCSVTELLLLRLWLKKLRRPKAFDRI